MTNARHYAHSSSFKIALLFTVLCGLTVIVFGYFIYFFSHDSFVQTVETSIDSDMRYIRLVHDTLPDHAAFMHFLSDLTVRPDHLYIFTEKDDPQLTILAGKLPPHINHLTEGLLVFERQQKQYAAKIQAFDDGSRLLIGLDMTALVQDHHRMVYLSIGSIVLMLLVILISYAISRFVVTRTNNIVLRAQSIMETGDLSRRLNVDSDWDDLSYMTNVLNQFLDRIERLMQGVRQVSDNIAHDLRTPLTRMRHSIERLKDPKIQSDQTKLQDLGSYLGNEADHLLEIFNALLRISRIESGHQHNPFETISLDMVLRDVIELYEPLAEEKSLTITTALQSVSCQGDRHLLFQAFANLLDNAVKFTPAKAGDIAVTLIHSGSEARISICDQGLGIPDAYKAKVFERYYRADSSRHLPGSGLGLSLVQAIVTLHHGTIALHTPAVGLDVIITLPCGKMTIL